MIQLADDWYLTGTAPGAFNDPSTLSRVSHEWLSACVPGTVAQSLSGAGRWSLNDRFDFDGQDYWYRTEFSVADLVARDAVQLHLDGLATLCEVWLNGERVLISENMFLSHQVDISEIVQSKNSLYLCFRSLTKALSQRRVRPRWKTKLVDKQQLRWFRTSLLGRIPGWTPPVAPVGPWKAVYLSRQMEPLNISLMQSLDGGAGVVEFACDINHPVDEKVSALLSVGSEKIELNLEAAMKGSAASGKLRINDIEHWWPHTHGKPKLYPVRLDIKNSTDKVSHKLAPVGFKKVHVEPPDDSFSIAINDKKVFCRGACWTVNDIVSLAGDIHALEQTLILMRDAGVNMIRVGGTMLYEQDVFYQLCDRLGILVWQDFMFANMDYPVDDEDFNSSITMEVKQQLVRMQKHACVTLYCGNSEVEQQAAMLGMPDEVWSNRFFSSQLPDLCREHHPGVPYLSSTPTGGGLPFHTDAGITHYYGVGAYRLPVSDVRRHSVKFTPECLGFSNVPVALTRNNIIGKQIPVVHHPKWKERVPRDTGTGWDFEDIRDRYLEERFSVNTALLRSYDNDRYLALSEIITGEVMSQVFDEWRSRHSDCSGGLVWFLKDLWPGAGWGIVDSLGRPKAVYYYLKRCWQPVNVSITDESLNGLHAHVSNETGSVFTGELEVRLLNQFSTDIASKKIEVSVDSGAIELVELDRLLGTFLDTTYSYRFGPPRHSVVFVRLVDQAMCEVSTAYYFPARELPRVEERPALEALITKGENGDDYLLELSCDRFLYAVTIDLPGYLPAENYFHLMPGLKVSIKIRREGDNEKKPKGYISAINMNEDVRVVSR